MAERITGHTELIGLMAYPIRHSSSPAMHNEAFATLGLDYAYLAFEVDNSTLEDAVKGLRALKMVGSNVSMPVSSICFFASRCIRFGFLLKSFTTVSTAGLNFKRK